MAMTLIITVSYIDPCVVCPPGGPDAEDDHLPAPAQGQVGPHDHEGEGRRAPEEAGIHPGQEGPEAEGGQETDLPRPGPDRETQEQEQERLG
jgi:hypothetical protein